MIVVMYVQNTRCQKIKGDLFKNTTITSSPVYHYLEGTKAPASELFDTNIFQFTRYVGWESLVMMILWVGKTG